MTQERIEQGVGRMQMGVGLVLGATIALLPGCGSAMSAEVASTAPAVKAVIECRALVEPAQRLACYDKTVGEMAGADAKGDLITLDQNQRREIRHQAFGFAMPAFTLFNRGEKPEEASKATFKIAQAWQDAQHHWTLTLETGAVWVQTDTTELYSDPHVGSVADIRKGVLDSFFMLVDGQQAIRVKRVS